jgi:hypothetical protein
VPDGLLSKHGTTGSDLDARTCAGLLAYHAAKGSLRRLAPSVGISPQYLGRIAKNARKKGTCGAPPELCARILAALDGAPLGRSPSRRLKTRLDECRPLARDPYVQSATALWRFSHERGWMSPATRDTEWQEVLTLADAYAEQDRRGRSTFSYRKQTGGNESAAVALYRRERRRRSAECVFEGPPQALDGVPPSHHVTSVSSRRVPDVRAVLHAPGTWSPKRLRTFGLSCFCDACQQDWPTADDWWREHNLEMQRRWPRKIRRVPPKGPRARDPHGEPRG